MRTCVLFLMALGAWAQSPGAPVAPARVFIYEARMRGLRPNPIFCDGIEVASLRHKWSYFVLQLPPGEHSFRGRFKPNELILDLSAGHDYFLRLDNNDLHEKLNRESTAKARLTTAMVTSGKLKPIERDDVRDEKVLLTFTPSQVPQF